MRSVLYRVILVSELLIAHSFLLKSAVKAQSVLDAARVSPASRLRVFCAVLGLAVAASFALTLANAVGGFWSVEPAMSLGIGLLMGAICILALSLPNTEGREATIASALILVFGLTAGLTYSLVSAIALVVAVGAVSGLVVWHLTDVNHVVPFDEQSRHFESDDTAGGAIITRDSTLIDPLVFEGLQLPKGSRLADRIHINDQVALLQKLGTLGEEDQNSAVVRFNTAGEGQSDCFEVVEIKLARRNGKTRMDMTSRETSLSEAAPEPSVDVSCAQKRVLALVTHELRTPLNAIIGFSEMLQTPDLDGVTTDRQKQHVDMIHRAGSDLLDLVNTLLDVSKIDAGAYDVHPELFDLCALTEDCVTLMQPAASAKAIHLNSRLDPRAKASLADCRAVRQVVMNLLSNAVKFTPEKGCVGIEIRALDARGGFAIKVTDTGIGMKGHELDEIFKPFARLQTEYARSTDGTGLGLALVKGLVDLHNGHLNVESRPDVGTAIEAVFPARSGAFKNLDDIRPGTDVSPGHRDVAFLLQKKAG